VQRKMKQITETVNNLVMTFWFILLRSGRAYIYGSIAEPFDSNESLLNFFVEARISIL